jgi:CRP-like cAMP-binding protein
LLRGGFRRFLFGPATWPAFPRFDQALTPGSLLLIPVAEFASRVISEEPWLRAAHELAHRLLMKKFLREYQLLTLSARERYELLETAHPQLIREIPAFHLASYLGISPVSLSRLRGGRKRKSS